VYLSIGSIIIDDIILPDGRSQMGVLGGGGTHAVMGMRAWSDQVRFIAGVGSDFPHELEDQLSAVFDMRGLIRRSSPTPRAWQLFEYDGHRSEIFRTGYENFLSVNPLPQEIPLEMLQVKGVHLQPHAPDPLREWIVRLHQANCPFILWEPWGIFAIAENYPLVCEILPTVDCFSPNLEESLEMTGLNEPREIVEKYLSDGAKMVALRMGERGSLVKRSGGDFLEMPALPVEKIVDVTGAGNAYCGGLVVGLGETGSLEEAVCYAAVSASLALEQFGAMIPLGGLHERAVTRMKLCAPK
jgi:sugar/nucleoside kinase (ribokinase family)